jgi:hypothetical protein
MSELKPVTFHWEEIEKYSVFKIMRFEVKCDGSLIGYYRIWHDPDTENIAFYSEHDKHGVLPPGTYKSIPKNHKLIQYIEDDLNRMGYTIPDAHSRITDGMLIGTERFPSGWAAIY